MLKPPPYQEYQALVAKIDDSITENTQHVVAREQMLTVGCCVTMIINEILI